MVGVPGGRRRISEIPFLCVVCGGLLLEEWSGRRTEYFGMWLLLGEVA